jgi:hypothetical protein
MYSTLLTLALSVGAEPEPPAPQAPRPAAPRLVDGLPPLKPLSAQAPLIRPVLSPPPATSVQPSLNLPALAKPTDAQEKNSARTIQVDRPTPSGPSSEPYDPSPVADPAAKLVGDGHFGLDVQRAMQTPARPNGPSSAPPPGLPISPGVGSALANITDALLSWFDSAYMREENELRFRKALGIAMEQIPINETREFVRVFDTDGFGHTTGFRGLAPNRTFDEISEDRGPSTFWLRNRPPTETFKSGPLCIHRNGWWWGACDRYTLPTLLQTISSQLPGDRIAEGRILRDVAAMKDLAARQAEYNREKLGYDRVRSLWVPAGAGAASSVRDYVPQAVPAHARGVQIGPLSKPAAPVTPHPGGWHPPLALPKSTPLP